jgi:hypothetical protein
MAIGLEAKGYRESETRAGKRHRNRQKVAEERRKSPEIKPQGKKEIGVIKKEKSKLRHMLGIEHGNIPIQLDLWGNEVLFRGKGQTTLYGYPC